MIAVAPPHKNQLNNYLEWLEYRQLKYHVLNEDELITDKFSMLLLCGGADIGKNFERDLRETKWFGSAYGNIPVLGICRGLQLVNVALGGTLYGDILNETQTKINHSANAVAIANEPLPSLESSWHFIAINGMQAEVNSRHHQAIKTLGQDIHPVAKSDDGIIEMAWAGDNCMLVQWHPEREEVRGTFCERIVSEWLYSKTFPSLCI
ncbi:MAG: gamma-glutamyl-gamma-aminobutyrate hydrolase family protein [Candidatus Pacearchaeota archaeon]|jgi:gamma-glutamyl-gamma-aminobutyrate hydrolase PuuD|nr:gamma-glutamyl-gamma-aminobutyrate hydrolase family protein [Clostridia bacterium]